MPLSIGYQRPTLEFDQANECHALPLRNVKEVVELLPYASAERVMFLMLYYTGARISELDKMNPKNLYDGYLYWPLGKNQKRWRKEKLPDDFILELSAYREKYSVPSSRIFHYCGESLRRVFNRDIRSRLPSAWQRKRLIPTRAGFKEEYILQMKGLRKTFQTVDFARELRKWNDAGFAMHRVAKRMKHSSTKITVSHYLEDLEAIGLENRALVVPDIAFGVQKRLMDF